MKKSSLPLRYSEKSTLTIPSAFAPNATIPIAPT